MQQKNKFKDYSCRHCNQNNQPIVIWSADMAGQALISSPEEGQKTIAISEIGGRNEDGSIQVLTVQRSKTTPKKVWRDGLFSLKEHKAVLIQVLVASFFVQLFGLLNHF